MKVKVIIEQRTQGFLMYVPALKLYMTGDSKDATMKSLIEAMEADRGEMQHIQDSSIINHIEGLLYIIEYSSTDDRYFGYVPAMDLSVVGDNKDEAISLVHELILSHDAENGRPLPQNNATWEYIYNTESEKIA